MNKKSSRPMNINTPDMISEEQWEKMSNIYLTPQGWYMNCDVYNDGGQSQNATRSIFLEFNYSKKAKTKFKITLHAEIWKENNQKDMKADFSFKDIKHPSEKEEAAVKKFFSEIGEEKKYWLFPMTINGILSFFEERDPDEYNKLWPPEMYPVIKEIRIEPDSWIVEWPYEIDFDAGKLYRRQVKRDDENEYRGLISDLVVVTAEYQDMAKEDEIYFRYLIKNGKRKQKSFIMSAGKISDKEFLDDIRKKIIVISGEEKNFTRFLTLFAMKNRDENRLAHFYFSSRTGWTNHEGKLYFMLGNRVFDLETNHMSPAVPVEDLTGHEEFFAGIADSGNYEEWIREWIPAIRAADPSGCRIFLENTNLWFTIYALSASLLMNLFPGIENTLIINSGTTSRGKSTIAKIAASLFGDPKKFITLGSGTENGIWNAWLKWNYLPSIMDEFTNTKQETKNKIPYWFSDGKEKTRLNKDSTAKKVNEFRKIGYISLENDFVNQVMRSGVDARVIPIFDGLNLPETEDEEVNTVRAALIDDLARVKSHKYFGFYKNELLKTISQVGIEKINELYDAVSKTYTTTNDTLTARLGASFALFHVSGFLVEMTNERLQIRGRMKPEEIQDLVENRCREILGQVIQNIGDHDWQVVLADVLARADNSETRTRWLTDEQLMYPYRSDDESSIRYPDKIEAWFCNDGMIEYVDVAPDVVKTVCISTVGKPSMNNVLKEWTDKKIIRPLREDQKTVMHRHYDVQGGKKVRTPVYRINLQKAKELTGYDLLYRRRELLDEIQSDFEEFNERGI